MCQLLGMNCNVPTDICFSFEGFQARGGKTDEHKDGWGIAFFEGVGCRVFIDDKASIDSPIAELVKHYPIHSKNVIAHIRKATKGEIALHNTHPFMREMWGRYWIFAHNGDLENFNPQLSNVFCPVGNTDSELSFCHILTALHQNFPHAPPDIESLYAALKKITAEISQQGIFNYLLSNGEYFFVHCSTKLSYIVRKAPFTSAHLIDEDVMVDFNEVTTPNDKVAVIATTPLTDNETWTTIEKGQLLAFHNGEPLAL